MGALAAGATVLYLTRCRACHGTALGGKSRTPPIAGLAERRILDVLAEPPRVMRAIVRGLDADTQRAVARHIAGMTPGPARAPTPPTPQPRK